MGTKVGTMHTLIEKSDADYHKMPRNASVAESAVSPSRQRRAGLSQIEARGFGSNIRGAPP